MADIARFGRFVLAGCIAASINVAMRLVLSLVMPYEAAVVLAYIVAMLLAFALSKMFVFEASSGSSGRQVFRFAVVNLVSLAIVLAVSVGLYRFVFPAIAMDWHPELAAHVIGVMSPVFAAYLMHKHFTFGKPKP